MVHADLAQIFLLRRPRRAENHQAARLRQLHRRDAHAARRAVNQNAVARLQIAHREHRVVRREIVHGDRRGSSNRMPAGNR